MKLLLAYYEYETENQKKISHQASRMKILFLNRWVGAQVGGTERHIKELALRLAKRGHEVHILTTEGEQLEAYKSIIKTWYITRNPREAPHSRGLNDDPWLLFYGLLSGMKLLLKLLWLRFKGIKYDVVSVHCNLEAILMFIYRMFFGTPYVFVFEGYTSLEGRLAKYADAQIAISQTVADNCLNEFGYEANLISIGIDRNKFTPIGERVHEFNSIRLDDKKVVLTVGRLGPSKRIPMLLSVARIVCKKDPDFLFLIVGEGLERKRIEKIIADYGLQGNVILTGRVSDEILAALYRSADIFASTMNVLKTGDQFMIVYLEAMSSGLPVIWTSEVSEAKKVEDWGVLVPPERTDLLAEKILEIANNKELKQNLIKRGFDISEKYDWNRLIAQYEKVYISVIKKE